MALVSFSSLHFANVYMLIDLKASLYYITYFHLTLYFLLQGRFRFSPFVCLCNIWFFSSACRWSSSIGFSTGFQCLGWNCQFIWGIIYWTRYIIGTYGWNIGMHNGSFEVGIPSHFMWNLFHVKGYYFISQYIYIDIWQIRQLNQQTYM